MYPAFTFFLAPGLQIFFLDVGIYCQASESYISFCGSAL